jgi:hypothetical protein
MADARLCLVCAWRADCQKKYSISKNARYCPEFSRDLSIKEDPETEVQKEKKCNEQKGK